MKTVKMTFPNGGAYKGKKYTPGSVYDIPESLVYAQVRRGGIIVDQEPKVEAAPEIPVELPPGDVSLDGGGESVVEPVPEKQEHKPKGKKKK